MSSVLQITDVTLRDGLQMEKRQISLEQKLRLCKLLSLCGFDRIELTSFVNPKWVPQFIDSEAFCEKVFADSSLPSSIQWMAFIPNTKGLERLLKFPIQWACAFVAASESFNKKNVNSSIEESLEGLRKIIEKAHAEKRKVRVYVSTLFGCPYEGKVSLEQSLAVLKKVAMLNPDEIALSDTIGVATPSQVKALVEGTSAFLGLSKIAMHFHNTYGLALSAAQAAFDVGVRKFDGATGGVGGCPYAKGASGNVSTEELVYLFYRQNILAENKFTQINEVLKYLSHELGLNLHSHLYDISSKGGEVYEGK